MNLPPHIVLADLWLEQPSRPAHRKAMSMSFNRRSFLSLTPALFLAPRSGGAQDRAAPPTGSGSFPIQERDLVREMVGVCHGNLARVKELVSARPALARASWDWGFGDHESAIDAASRVGNRPIRQGAQDSLSAVTGSMRSARRASNERQAKEKPAGSGLRREGGASLVGAESM